MGVVDLALDDHGRPVALKRLVLHGSAHDMARARQRVRREAEALARLDHPAIVRLIDVIDHDDDIVLVMPYLAGGTLADHVRARGPLTPPQVHHLADTLLGALAAAHRQGVVHRDLKPANVLFDHDGRPYLSDFGVASLRDATSGLTTTGLILGTPEFMAPEQARGERVSAASDVFSLGATLLYAATGEPPYGRGDPAVLVQRAAKGRLVPWPSGLDPSVRRRLAPLLRRDRDRRPTAAAAAGGPEGTRLLPPRPLPRAPARPGGPPSSRAVRASVAAVAVLLVVALVALVVVGRHDRPVDASTGLPTSTVTSVACHDLPYQPCGRPAAPFTDGTGCVENHADYDGDKSNGCEAAPDTLDGTSLGSRLVANLVPTDDVDRYPFHVDDHFHLTCDGTLVVALTGPAGASVRLEVLQGTTLLGQAVSANGAPTRVSLVEPSCLEDDSTDLVARVSWVGDARSAAGYTLTRTGSY